MIATYKTLLLPDVDSYKLGSRTVKNTVAALAGAKANMLKAANETFATEIASAAALTGLKKEFFLPFGQHETQWRNVLNSAGSSASGPMQVMPGTVEMSILQTSSFMSADCRTALVRLLGPTRGNGYLKPGLSIKKARNNYGRITKQELLQKPELSILGACLNLAYLCRANVRAGQIDIIRVLLQYSEGDKFIVANTPTLQLKEIKLRHSAQSYNYVISMVGKNGLMTAFS